MIYTDRVHVVADSLDELHDYAQDIGITRKWYEGVRKGHPYYDIPIKRLSKVLESKVRIVSTRIILQISKQMK